MILDTTFCTGGLHCIIVRGSALHSLAKCALLLLDVHLSISSSISIWFSIWSSVLNCQWWGWGRPGCAWAPISHEATARFWAAADLSAIRGILKTQNLTSAAFKQEFQSKAGSQIQIWINAGWYYQVGTATSICTTDKHTENSLRRAKFINHLRQMLFQRYSTKPYRGLSCFGHFPLLSSK